MNLSVSLLSLSFTCCHRRASSAVPPAESQESVHDEWEIVSRPAAEPAAISVDPQPLVQPPYLERGPTALELTCTDIRYYCVWSLPGHPEVTGVHWGRGKKAYAGLIALNNGTFGGLKWKRCDSWGTACDTFDNEKGKHRLAGANLFCFYWP